MICSHVNKTNYLFFIHRVELATFFAPVAYVDHMISPIAWIAPFAGFVDVRKNITTQFRKIKCINAD